MDRAGPRVCVVGAGAIGTFIGARLTAVTEIGERVGVPTPNTDALLGLVRVFAEAHHG
jgi:ketopantoate reductase